ncbi:3-oxoacyl-[acyl-carrier-protein] synthase-3 [Aneurinibacillus soli]|uniref:Beta-ketoacyl-[acyl-carrier-protein] synthase III n=1 Tax=Aneurinibacillus soli TaxID=1500254 RepID=A0A0U5B618_9BACL|nr:ketoacyl-ACP synthase III [Aneurinibacillus soli]PYE60620.1 3-oxoacyl-[acyl-carrier-protein] synthase-3 [Aneurinibacillus soli]BAU29856.1 3-oxoacyl-[acyl-carrier-protein] synthase 3 protein 2 [Aneurinibacillus soli]
MGNSFLSKAKITAIGTYAPERVLSNFDLEEMVDTSDEWIFSRTGIRERRIAAEGEFTTDLCVAAVQDLMKRYDKTVDDVDLILVATSTPDYAFPSVASQVQARLGIEDAGALDMNAACAGFVYALQMANSAITSGMNKKVLVIGAETLSKITDFNDRTTCILFGDGAGAMLVEYIEERGSFLSVHMTAKGEGGIHLYRTGLSNQMNGQELQNSGYIVQNGREVYKWAVTTVPCGMEKVMEKSGSVLEAVDWFVPHSANLRMIESICERSGFPLEKTLWSLEHFGNTSAASIPLALNKGIVEGKVKAGDRVLLYGFGGGLVQAGILLEWMV